MPRHVASLGSTPSRSLYASHANDVMPTNFPTTRPTTIPRVTDDVAASDTVVVEMATPALASANNGTITKLVHGCRIRSRYSTTDSSRFPSGLVGVSRPTATPAIVAWTPDSWIVSHNTTPIRDEREDARALRGLGARSWHANATAPSSSQMNSIPSV